MTNQQKADYMKNILSEYKLQELRSEAEEIVKTNSKLSWSKVYKNLLAELYNKNKSN